MITSGHVRLGADGSLRAEVNGLVVPATQTSPLPQIAAQVHCGGTLVATTAPTAFAPRGDATLRAKVALPAFCPAPAVLLSPAVGGSVHHMYVAFDGSAA